MQYANLRFELRNSGHQSSIGRRDVACWRCRQIVTLVAPSTQMCHAAANAASAVGNVSIALDLALLAFGAAENRALASLDLAGLAVDGLHFAARGRGGIQGVMRERRGSSTRGCSLCFGPFDVAHALAAAVDVERTVDTIARATLAHVGAIGPACGGGSDGSGGSIRRGSAQRRWAQHRVWAWLCSFRVEVEPGSLITVTRIIGKSDRVRWRCIADSAWWTGDGITGLHLARRPRACWWWVVRPRIGRVTERRSAVIVWRLGVAVLAWFRISRVALG